MDLWEEDSYYDFCWYSNFKKNMTINDIAKESYENCLSYNLDYLGIIELPTPID